MKECTISDIAKKAGVGKATVSRVINKSGYVKEETREKIVQAMEELNFIPSATARNLSFRQSNAIGIVFPEITTPFGIGILKGVGRVIEKNNLVMIVCNTDVTPEGDIVALKQLREQRVCGLLFVSAVEYGDDEKSRYVKSLLSSLSAPVVLVDRYIPGTDFDGVYSENLAGAYAATEALIHAGHKRIGSAVGNLGLHIGRSRLLGFKQALEDNGLEFNEDYCIFGRGEMQQTYEKAKAFLQNKDLPTAMFASNDLSGKGLLRAIHEKGLRVPDEMAFIGFDPIDGYIYGKEYSCLNRDAAELGEKAAEILMKRLKEELPEEPKVLHLSSDLCLVGTERYTKG
ncbi:LacI family DNA-binding transcriptional regulator [Ruthenibacterium lactatiformans]|uniref:LacI family DNA-binding transcriptional regulator n=1 Tax=Ruthenibacterium lactatiformans TaxID=1550024 RepID=UPI00399F745A